MTEGEFNGRVTIYSIVGCPHCLRAKNKLAELDIPFSDINLDSYPHLRDDVKQRTGGKQTVPQIFFNEIYIGGNDDLQALIRDSAKFQKMADLVKNTVAPESAPQIPDPSTAVDFGSADFVCEPDAYLAVVRDLKKSGLIKNHIKGLKSHKNSFYGSELVDWLMKTKQLDRGSAFEMASEIIGRSFGSSVKQGAGVGFDEEGLYRLLEDDDSSALNAGPFSDCVPLKAAELSEKLRRLILNVYNDHLSKDGKSVDYAGIAKSSEFENYVTLTRELQRVDVKHSTRNEKLAFFINVYNALVIHATIAVGKPSNLWQRYKFFNTMSYIIGGHLYTLQDMENGVLRGNKKGVGMFKKPFQAGDPRLNVALEEGEPKIHFALNCGAKSCPPIKTFSAKGVSAELKVATESFLETDEAVSVDFYQRLIQITQLFKWYKEDFGTTNDNVVRWIMDNMAQSSEKLALLQKTVSNPGYYKLKYLPYDWGDNKKDK